MLSISHHERGFALLVHTQQEPGFPIHVTHSHSSVVRNPHPYAVGVELVPQLQEGLTILCEREQGPNPALGIDKTEFLCADRLRSVRTHRFRGICGGGLCYNGTAQNKETP